MSQNKVNILNGRLSKEHYCYKMHTLLMKISAYSPLPFCRQPPLYGLALHFYKKIVILRSMICQKLQPPLNKQGIYIRSVIFVKAISLRHLLIESHLTQVCCHRSIKTDKCYIGLRILSVFKHI